MNPAMKGISMILLFFLTATPVTCWTANPTAVLPFRITKACPLVREGVLHGWSKKHEKEFRAGTEFLRARSATLLHVSAMKTAASTTRAMASTAVSVLNENEEGVAKNHKRNVVIIGAGWAGLSAAYRLSSSQSFLNGELEVTVVDASPRVGGLVRDGFVSQSTEKRPAEAGQHGFWNNYRNIYNLLEQELELNMTKIFTERAEQGQYSPEGLEAVWPVYRDQAINLPTGLAQLVYTRFFDLPLVDRISALPLVVAFSEFDDSPAAWERYDDMSFRDLCVKLGVTKRCYDEAFEPMILTGLFAPGTECSAAAALGMAYFFVLQSQTAFDVQWCRGNIGDVIFQPWVDVMREKGVKFECSTRFTGVDIADDTITKLHCTRVSATSSSKANEQITFEPDEVVFAVGAKALSLFVRFCPELAAYDELRRFANLRGTSVLATRMFLDKNVTIPFSANACWGFDKGIGMTMFDIKKLHGLYSPTVSGAPGSVVEVDYYYASKLIAMSDDQIKEKVKKDLDTLFGIQCEQANVVDAAIIRLPEAVNWYFPGSYKDMPDVESKSVKNLYFCGDIVRTRHGSWSQEKAYVTGLEAANLILRRPLDSGVLPVAPDEPHVKIGRDIIAAARTILGVGDPTKGPSITDFWR